MVRVSGRGVLLAARGEECERLANAAAFIHNQAKLIAADLGRHGRTAVHLKGGGLSLLVVPVLLGALFTVHLANGFFFSNPNGGWEYLAFWIAAQVALALTGDGAYALKPGLPFGKAPRVATQAL